MHEESGFENLILKGTTEAALKRFAKLIEWPHHLARKYPDPEAQTAAALAEYFDWSKGNGGIADFLVQCSEAEIPEWLRGACIRLKAACTPAAVAANSAAISAGVGEDPGAGADAAD